MGRIIPYIMENKKCLKPPTSIYIRFREPNWENDVIDIYKPTNLEGPCYQGYGTRLLFV
jgi:hypothetical protein